jgi:hypothetical protein
MRKLIVPAAVLAVCLMASVSSAAITGSKHDFGSQGWSGGQTCAPCHAPHTTILKDADGNLLGGPLWNHELSKITDYKVYDDTGAGKTAKMDQNSKLCLSCHDGTVALDSFGGVTGTSFITNPKAVFGNDLSDDHPVGGDAAWPQTFDPTATKDANGNDVTGKGGWTGRSSLVVPNLRDAKRIMPLRKMADGTLVVGCTSCHEPHNKSNQDHLLWVKNTGAGTTVDGRAVNGSTLCLNCHIK